MTRFAPSRPWDSPSNDPNDETFGDVVGRIDVPNTDDGLECDVVLAGEPFDAAVVGRRGAANGPTGIRNALVGVKTHSFDEGPTVDPPEVGDVGDIDVSSIDTAAIQRRVESVTADLHDTDALPVFLGGDNSLTVPNAKPLLEAGSLGVVNLDAHLDVRELRETPTSGTPYRQLFEAGLDAYACVGARHHETSTAYADYVAERGGTVVTAEAVGRDFDGALRRAEAAVEDVDRLYVSVDCDVLDAAAAPGVSAPTPGGLTTRELFAAVRRLAADARVAGFEVVECAPPLDEGDRTAAAAARTVAHFLAGYEGEPDD
jgi:formimidoylglutamase